MKQIISQNNYDKLKLSSHLYNMSVINLKILITDPTEEAKWNNKNRIILMMQRICFIVTLQTHTHTHTHTHFIAYR